IYSLGWQKGYEEASKIGITGIAAKFSHTDITSSKAMFLNKNTFIGKGSNTMPLEHLDWNPASKKILTVLIAIYPSLSPNFSTNPKNDNDASPFTFGVDFFFVMIPTAYSHLTLPSNNPSKSLHTRMGLSFQLPKKTQVALERIKKNVYSKDADKRTGVLGI
ncbi:hypothetical protein VP01_10181g1, partial [Puccinia sorghi]